ncbi:unnamed protein product [Penicillium salamii]|uniref:Zn(2)-C6 fungal-type domain-containing protein n=1 Tax=Penicillium salamii TaxID=1612424 RepID=A0A9W4INQ2_9EURO|nr:unnamed protein product [Penicillium salamii]CAG8121015.1 unnamed protein product [Penicillium salamii]CAG8290789.1 unnamed protein product [Penicillium salamii]CAG8342939.1 unnamed protein product [Penicillium salamii]CAG8344821.1 unnamed protein product [Penicillium salamii]
MEQQPGSYTSSRSRRSHRKSRLGCGNCKARRVKCDETEPNCNNCLRHSIKCDFGQPRKHASSVQKTIQPPKPKQKPTEFSFISSSQSEFRVPKRTRRETDSEKTVSLPDSEPETAVAPRPFQFTTTDMALFHHCFSADDLKGHIPDELVRLGFSVHYVLRLLLAVAGFHLQRKTAGNNSLHLFLEPNVDFGVEAERHLQIAIESVAAAAPQLNSGNSSSLYIASVYIFICSLARGPRAGECLAFRDDEDIPSLCLFFGIRSILEASTNMGAATELFQLHSKPSQDSPPETQPEAEPHPITEIFPYTLNDDNTHNFRPYWKPLNNLQSLIFEMFNPTDSRYFIYQTAFESLCSSYDAILGTSIPVPGPELWPRIFTWLYQLPEMISHDMQKKHPVALLLMSFFSVLLNELDSVWFITGWPRHIVGGVSRSLDDRHRVLLEWPLQTLGMF